MSQRGEQSSGFSSSAAAPSGLSAALSLARARRSAVLFHSGEYRNAPSKHLHTFITWDHQDPAELRTAARKELFQGRYSTVKYSKTAVSAVAKLPDGTFRATDATGSAWVGDKLVLATGCWGKQIYHCMFCHGFEDTGAKSAGLLAIPPLINKDMCFTLACMVRQFSASLTYYTNANQQLTNEIQLLLKPEAAMKVDGITVHFADGTSVHEAFLAYQPKTEANVGMVKDLGLEISPSGADLKVNAPFNDTNVAGCFAVGDVSTPLKALAHAVGSGSFASPAIVQQFIKEGRAITLESLDSSLLTGELRSQ
ncbi:thioredoxin reductase [Leptodontidium sp. 2 PMI_412]|nr:thioredoxin reductase [Leptodontidium sp. 2 PMI_412]